MTAVNYKENDSWGNIGWLGSDEYYTFWGRVFANDLVKIFEGKTILDVGAGNGRVWQKALNTGLSVKELHLIDPALNITPALSKKSEIISHKTALENLQKIHGDVAVFKQSIHHVHESIGLNMFDILQAQKFIIFSMPSDPDWPMSPALKKKFAPSYLDVRDIVKTGNKRVTDSFLISYPVEMNREEWCSMLKQRFTSILHNCDDDFIDREIKWVNDNLPNKLQFLDHLECLVFE